MISLRMQPDEVIFLEKAARMLQLDRSGVIRFALAQLKDKLEGK